MHQIVARLVVLAIGMTLGVLVGDRLRLTGSDRDRANEIEINCPDAAPISGRAHHQLRIYRTHGDPITARPPGSPNFWMVTLHTARGDQTYFAEEVAE